MSAPQLGMRRRARELVPGTDGETIVAAVDPVPHQRPQLLRDLPLVLDREIRDAAPRIEPVGRRKGAGRACLEAPRAGAAAVAARRVRFELAIEIDLAEEQP